MIIDEIMVVQKQDMQKHVRTPEITCTQQVLTCELYILVLKRISPNSAI